MNGDTLAIVLFLEWIIGGAAFVLIKDKDVKMKNASRIFAITFIVILLTVIIYIS